MVLACTYFLTGCGPMNTTSQSSSNHATAVEELSQVQSSTYNPSTATVHMVVNLNPARVVGENVVDLNSSDGINNYAMAKAHGQAVQRIEVSVPGRANRVYHPAPVTSPGNAIASDRAGRSGSVPSESAFIGGNIGLPRGTRLDRTINPIAGIGASVAQKQVAVERIAKSKLGTPYIWGHNEDRGQYGFDCSNYVEYVFHHALGYTFSGASKVQYRTLGHEVSRWNMQAGDIIFFERGAHEGIYAGNHQIIQEGGGKGQVSYLSVRPGTYWGSRISSVRRLF